MTSSTVVAPGKLFVIGEYAVLGGSRALLAGVDAGIRCELSPGRERIVAPDLDVDLPFDVAASHPRAKLLVSAARAAAGVFGIDRRLRVRVEGTRPAARRKRGLGGSAASVVAIVGAFAALADHDLASPAVRRRIFRVAWAVHLAHQRGRGSGADVATSVWGGWVDFRGGRGEPRMVPARVPAGFALTAVWSGVPSDTAAAVARWRGNDRLAVPLGRFWKALEREDRTDLLEAVCEYGDALGFGDGPGAVRVRRLVEAARGIGVGAKGSGAVGGDCVVAVGFESDALDAARAAWRDLGAEVLDLRIDESGVHEEACHA